MAVENLNDIPPELKHLAVFLQRSQELKIKDPTMSHWCFYYFVQQGVHLKPRAKESRNYLYKLMTSLETIRADRASNVLTDETRASTYIEDFALRVFDSADNECRRGDATLGTAKTFLAAADFLELLKVFEESPNNPSSSQDNGAPSAFSQHKDKIRYAKRKAADVVKALREGRRPTPGLANGPDVIRKELGTPERIMFSDSEGSAYNSVALHNSPIPRSASTNANSSEATGIGTPIPASKEIAAQIDDEQVSLDEASSVDRIGRQALGMVSPRYVMLPGSADLIWRRYGEELPAEVAPRPDDPSWETFSTIFMGLDGVFRREGELNSGAYGSYADVSKTEAWFEGRIRVQVAVKRLRLLGIQDPYRPHASEVSQKCKMRLNREVRIWMGLRHPNIAPLLGYCGSGAFYMISPWFQNGNISEYLRRKNPEEHERVVLVSQVASGLAYLHGLSPPVVHGDIKPDNIVVDEEGRPQIIDFGLSKAIEEESGSAFQGSSSRQGAGNVRWVAPELLIQAGRAQATSSDVYSFGCVALFAMTGDPPFGDSANEFQVCYARSQGAQPVRGDATYPCFEQRLVLKELLHKCWAVAAEDRPTMVTVQDVLALLG